MNRSQRAVIATAAASTLAAGAAAALAVDRLGTSEVAVPVAQPLPPSADPSALHTQIDQLTARTDALQAELEAARKREQALLAAPPPAPVVRKKAPVVRKKAPVTRTSTVRRAKPAVHARTGASSAGHEREHEGRDDD